VCCLPDALELDGPFFHFSDGNWVYSLSTAGLSAEIYALPPRNARRGRSVAAFVLR